MADELRISALLDVELSTGVKINKRFNATLDVSGDVATYNVQEVGTTEETLTISADLTTGGYVLAKNLDDTNYVEIGSTTGVYDIKLKAGEFALWRHNSAAIYAKADTAAIDLEYVVVED